MEKFQNLKQKVKTLASFQRRNKLLKKGKKEKGSDQPQAGNLPHWQQDSINHLQNIEK